MIPELITSSLLQADAAVQAIINGRVFPSFVPEGTPLPAIAYRRIDAHQLNRPLAVTRPGAYALCRARMRVVMLTSVLDYVTSKEIEQAARRACSNKVGQVAGFEGVHIGPPLVSPELPDPPKGMTVDAFDVLITYREPLN